MDDMSIALVSKALDGLTLRSSATAQNIANANSDRYRPVQVTFEDSLRAASAKGIDAVRAVRPQISAATDPALRLDLEMATAAGTARRYGALVEVLSRQLQLGHAVIRGGR